MRIKFLHHKSEGSGLFNRHSEKFLVDAAVARDSPCKDLSFFSLVLAKQFGVLEIDKIDIVLAETAGFPDVDSGFPSHFGRTCCSSWHFINLPDYF